jgi:hypothetical protein
MRARASALWTAFGWAVLFTAAHAYWYAGGTVGLGDAPSPLPGRPTSIAAWVFTVVVAAMFATGIVLPLILLRWDARRGWGRAASVLLWIGAAVLVLRGASGLADDLLRQTGLAGGGITGLTYQDTLGTSDPSTYTLASNDSIDAYFLLGGLLFGLAAWHQSRLGPVRRGWRTGR